MNKYTRYIIICLFALTSFAFADQGPGDTYGYNWTDTETPAPSTSYSWIDMSGETSRFNDIFDDSTDSVTLPYSFTLYGTSSTQLYISSNGWISFNNPDTNSYHTNAAIPTGGAPNALIAPFWDDLASTTTGGGVYYRTEGTTPNRRSIVEWDIINSSGNINFQVILYERTNMIKFQYRTVDALYDGGVSATIGIESDDGSSGNQYSFNTSGSVSANSAILFHNEAVTNYSASLLPATVPISDFVTFTYTINNFIPTGAENVGKIDRIAIGNPFSTTPTITSVSIDGQSALIQNTSSAPTDPTITTWYYKTTGPSDSLIVQATQFNVAQSIVVTYLQAIPEVTEGNYTYASTVDAQLYTASALATSSQPQVSVTGGSVSYILIRDESDGNGMEVTTVDMTTDESITLYAAGYDAGDNFIDDQDVTWTLTGNLPGTGGTGTNFIFNPSIAPRSGNIEAELVSIGATDQTGLISVSAGTLNTLQIRTGPLESGSPVTTFNMTTDESQIFYAAGYDTEGNYRGDESVTWTSTLGISGSGTTIDYSPSAPTSGTLTATGTGGIFDTGTINVTEGELNYLIIRDAPGGVGAIVTNHTMDTDETLTLYAAGYDAGDNYKGDFVAVWTLTGSLDQPGITDSVFVFSPSTAPTSGAIIATVGGNASDATGTIAVNPGDLADVEIRTAPDNGGDLVTTLAMTTDDSQTFYAAGFDSEGNFRGNESVNWTSTLNISGMGTSILFEPDTIITGTLTATSGIYSYTTQNIVVTVGTLSSILVRDASNGGGSEVTTVSMTTDDSITIYAAGYDTDGNFRQDENVTWSLAGNLDGPGGGGTSFTFSPSTAPTTGSINASISGINDATGTISVGTGALSYLLIRTEANNGGYQVFTFGMTTDDTQTFWSAGYDADNNYRGDEASTNWTSSGDLGLSGSGASILFEPSSPVSGTLTASATGATPYETGSITVGGGNVHHIVIRNAPDGLGTEVDTITMTTDESRTLYAAGYEVGDTFIENTQVNWTLIGDLDGTPVNDTVFVFDPAEAPRSGSIKAQIGTIQDVTGNIIVNPGALANLIIRDEPNNGGDSVTTLTMSAGSSETFWAAGYDADGNYRQDEPAAVWTSTFGLGDTGPSFLFVPTLPDIGTITATINPYVYTTGNITVTGGILAKLIIRDGPLGGGTDLTAIPINLSADSSILLYAAGYDGSDNYIGDQVVDWSSTGSLDYINFNGTSYTFNPVEAPTSGTIAINDGTFGRTTGLISISVGDISSIRINDSAGSEGAAIDDYDMPVNTSLELFASSYDADGNYRKEAVVDWSSTGGLDAVSGNGSFIIFDPSTAPTTGTIVADTTGYTDQTGVISVNQGDLAYIRIRTATAGSGVVYGDTSLTADESLILFAAGYDEDDNYLFDVSVSWSSTGTLDDILATGTSFIFNPVMAPTIGTIVGTSGIYTHQTGNIDVSVGAMDYIRINSSAGAGGEEVDDLIMTADDIYTFFAASYDADNNFIANVAADWGKTGGLDDVSGTGTSYTFDPVTATRIGTITALFGGESDATGTITVNPGDLSYMQINNAAGAGGTEIGDTTINVGVDLVIYGSGYDQHGNFIGPENSLWRETGSLDEISATGEPSITFEPETAYTNGTIIATSNSNPSVSDTTGIITVEEGVLTSIQIRTAPDGQGSEFGEYSLTVDQTVTLYAAGYDGGDNFIGNLSVDWSSTPTLESISATDTSYEFSPTVAPRAGTIRIDSGALFDETETITVSPGAPVSMTDFNGLSGERTTVAGSTQLIRILVEDQYGNPVNGITVNFSPAGDMSVPSDITDSDGLAESVYNTPRDVDSSIVQASVSGLSPYNFTVYGINYVSGSLDPAVVQRGGSPSFTLQVSNAGNTTVPLSTGSSNFSFSGGSFDYLANLSSPSSLPANSSAVTLTFVSTLIDENFPGGSYTGELQLVGSGMNGVLQTDIGELTIGSDAITIGTVQIRSQLLQGETGVVATIPVLNTGPVLEIDTYPDTRIEFRRDDNGQIQPVDNLVRTDGTLFLQGGGVQSDLEFRFDLPAEYPIGKINIFVILSLDEGNLIVAPEEPSGSIDVLQAGNANYVEGSLEPEEVIPGEEVYFSASFENTGSASIILTQSTSTIEILGSGLGPISLISQFILTGDGTTEVFFNPLTIPPGLSTGDYTVRWHLNGEFVNRSEFDSIGVIPGGLTVVSPANLSFSDISVVPDRVKQGQTGIDVIYRIDNLGESTANITSLDHQFNFSAGGEVPENQWIPTQVSPELPAQVIAGGNRVITVSYALSTIATPGFVYPNPTVTYHDTRTPGIPFESNIIAQNDQVEVVEPASIKIVQLQALSPNTPYVNENQQFNLELTLENTGADQIATAWVSIFRNSEEESFTDQLIISNIAAGLQKSASFQHSEPSAETYLYKAYIDSAKDVVGDPVLINQPDDRDELMYVQVPSRLEIDASIVANSITSDSLVVSEDQAFVFRAHITNFGQSAFHPEGPARLSLRLPSSNFSFANGPLDTARTFTAVDTVVEWPLLSSGISGGIFEELSVAIIDIPIDYNTGNEVSDISLIDSVVHVKSEEKGRIDTNEVAIISPAGAQDNILSTKQEFTVHANIVFNETIADSGRFAIIDLPFGYSLKEGEQLIIDLSTSAPAEWTIISLDRDREGDDLFVTASGFDRNSGLPVTRESNYIPLTVVERTDLSMSLQIVKMGGSPGDTLSVGQQFTLQALILNDGDAGTEGEGKVYLEGIAENDALRYSNQSQEDTITFTIGEPVTWDLEVFQLPEGLSGLQSEIFQLLDELKKENAKTVTRGNSIATKDNRARELFTEISDLVQALRTVEFSLTVKMSQIPTDQNTNNTAFTEDSIVTKEAYIQELAQIVIQDIDQPQTVSTEQEFDLIITGSLIENLEDPVAHLLIPESFELANENQEVIDLPLDGITNQANYKINVPSTANYFGAARETLYVYLTGTDRNSGLPVIPSTTVPIYLTIQMRPEIYMDYEIISPRAAREAGELSHGQTIEAQVWPELVHSDKPLDYAMIINDGNIELDNEIFSQYKFEPVEGETYKKTFTQLGQRLNFKVRAPRENTPALLKFKFIDLPEDDNSGNEVAVNGDSGSVSLAMTVSEKKIPVTMMQNDIEKKTFTRGEGEHLMMAFEISNADYLDPLTIKGIGIKFIARSDTAALLDDAILNILEKIKVVDFEELSGGTEKISSITSFTDMEIDVNNVSNPLQIVFDDLGYLNSDESIKLAVVATFRAGESSRSFRTVLNNVDAYDDTDANLVSIVDGEGRSINGNPSYLSDVFSIISTDQEKTFGNFPNPFGRPPNETTDIRFVLNSTSDVTLRIFSLAGELVRSAWNENLTNLPGGEIYYVVWDGKNDEGDTVLNGVYICVIEIRSGDGNKTYTTKIAYIK